ncbi:hypothetical protein ACFFX1_21780 [Dactylosporangium sucinum]|uniref:Uncharacterized protein n=1 Tax=Dactylosporangium sucinum TaxID=1424081 RepID=A0A917UG35_9ACTN|nr:hypothetical protein [Dactylosporangium sucinum]GGM90410.1 hypothetical protein GCM10007977_110540 [Dactylosporangium sucinum]
MRTIRYTAAVATIVMSLLNLPIAFDDGGAGITAPLAWLISLLGVAGIVAAVALLRSVAWATPAVITVGALNLIGAVVALVRSSDGAIIGLVLSAIGTGLAIAYAMRRPTAATPAR